MSKDGKQVPLDTTDLPELPQGWCWTTLEAIADIEGGITKDQKRPRSATMREIPYLRVANVQRGFLDLTEVKTILAEEDEIQALRLHTGDILFTEGGDRDKLGRGWVWNGEILECIHQNHIFRARPLLNLVDPKFVSYHGNYFGQKWFVRTGKQTTNLASINQGVLRRFPVPMAPLNEQRRIVVKLEELFSDLDAGVAALQRVKAKLKRYRVAVLKAAVGGRLTEDWRAEHRPGETAAELLQHTLTERRRKWESDQLAKFVAAGKEPPKHWREKYSEPAHEKGLFSLPESWTWASTLEVCERVENGNTPPSSQMFPGVGEIPFIKVCNLTKTGSLDFSVNPTFVARATHNELLARSTVLPNDVLMNIVGPPLGKVSVVPDDFPEWNTNQAVVRLRASRVVLPRYLAACLMCDDVLYWITRTARATAGQFNLSVRNSRLLPIPLPPLAEQTAIMQILDERLSQIKAATVAVDHSLRRAARLRRSILKRAFEGQLVSQDPNDEPASVLLERLRSARSSHEANRMEQSPVRTRSRRAKASKDTATTSPTTDRGGFESSTKID